MRREEHYSKEWACSIEKCNEGFNYATTNGFEDNLVMIAFLVAKDIPNNRKAVYANNNWIFGTRYDFLVNPPNNDWQQCRRRLDTILKGEGDETSDTLPEGVMSLDAFIEARPKWKEEGSYIFHKDHQIKVMQRCQKSGLCYIHAPEIVQHNLVALTDPECGVIDMVKMIRASFGRDDLCKHIFSDEGGDSINMLTSILEPDSLLTSFGNWDENLKKYGVGLLSHFAVYPDFYYKDDLSYDGKPEGEEIGRHAMALIGARVEGNETWMLLQNWWKKKQFVEVTTTYLNRCLATCFFVRTKQEKIPEKWPVTKHLYAENDNLDKQENLQGEY
ncbi:DNA replication licensing factor mcm5 [Acrasis kona]|uniref:DNA replication licensing factor mcm5 n=1 Tax=Acrasis kona TaxID=1008807 RepID=A0AAW2Z2H2_9EUKA